MSTVPLPFDTLESYENLKATGFSESQAKAQIGMIQNAVYAYRTATQKELATKADIQNVRMELQDVRMELKTEIQDVRLEVQNVRTELKAEIQDVRQEVQDLRLEVQTIRQEVQDVRQEVQSLRTELKAEIKREVQDVRLAMLDIKHEILKWMVAGIITSWLAMVGVLVALFAYMKP